MTLSLNEIRGFAKSKVAVIKTSIAHMTVEALRGALKISKKLEEDGTYTVKTALGITSVETEGASTFSGIPAEKVDDLIETLTGQAKSGAYDSQLLAAQKKVAEIANKTKATREAKKAAAEAAPEAPSDAEVAASL